MTQVDTLSAPQIRERMSHPSIDGDGHLIEVREAFVRFVEDRGYGALLEEPSARRSWFRETNWRTSPRSSSARSTTSRPAPVEYLRG